MNRKSCKEAVGLYDDLELIDEDIRALQSKPLNVLVMVDFVSTRKGGSSRISLSRIVPEGNMERLDQHGRDAIGILLRELYSRRSACIRRLNQLGVEAPK